MGNQSILSRYSNSGALTDIAYPGSIQDVSIGAEHAVALIQNRVITWGSNNYGQCGPVHDSFLSFSITGDEDDDVYTPSLMGKIGNISKIVSGDFHNHAIGQDDGKLYAWGSGVLGYGSEIYDMNPREIDLGVDDEWKISDIYAKAAYSMASIRKGDAVQKSLIWGYCPSTEGTRKILSPTIVTNSPDNFVDIVTGRHHFSYISAVDGNNWAISSYGHMAPSKETLSQTPYFPMYAEMDISETYGDEPFHKVEYSKDDFPGLTVVAGTGGNFLLSRIKESFTTLHHYKFDTNQLTFISLPQAIVHVCSSDMGLIVLLKDGRVVCVDHTYLKHREIGVGANAKKVYGGGFVLF